MLPNHRPYHALGLCDETVPVGSHICQIYSDEAEAIESLESFLLSGLQAGERCACFSEKVTPAGLGQLRTQGLDVDALLAKEELLVAGTMETYFQDERFDPTRMLLLLEEFYDQTLAGGYPACRVIGEMLPEIQEVKGGNQLMEYEACVTIQLREKPVTAVCQYNANHFDGATILEILKAHPQMIVRGAVVHNPFFIPPEQYLKQH